MKETKIKQTLVQAKKGSRHCSLNHDCCDLPMREQVPAQSNLARHCEERSDVAIQGGFKMTEVGLIPNDWKVKPFKNVATLINGRAFSQSELLERGKYRVLRVGNFGTNDSWYYSNLELPEKMYCNKGDLLYCWSCTYGAYIWNEEKTIYHYHIWKIADLKAEKGYLQYILNNDVAQQMNSSNGSTMSHITKGFLENRLFAFPPTIEEQQRIANALSDIDTLINNLEKLIAKKKNIKQGAMQQLLTGKKRLPGFGSDERTGSRPTDERRKECHSERSAKREVEESSGYKMTELGKIPTDWEVKKLGHLCSLWGRIGFRGYTREDLVDAHKGAITFSPSDIHDQKLNLENCTYISLKKYEESPEIKVFNGDIIFGKTASIGKCALVEGLSEKATINPQFVLMNNFKCNNRFLYYQLIDKPFQTNIWSICGGSTIPTMSQKKLKQQQIVFPSTHAEQTAIANVLSDMDTEIATLETKLAKYRKLKTGMMQQLLTGKIRLV